MEDQHHESERWENVEGWEHYQISSRGRLRGTLGLVRGQVTRRTGYRHYALSRNCYSKTFLAHRLVAAAFIGPANGRQVNHIDGNKLNNDISNLEYVTPKQNAQHALLMGLRKRKWTKTSGVLLGERSPNGSIPDSIVRDIFALRADGMSQDEIAVVFGCSQPHIGRILRREIRSWQKIDGYILQKVADIRVSRKGVSRPAKGCGMRPPRRRAA